MGGVLKENAEGAGGVSEGCLGAKDNPVDPKPKNVKAEEAESAQVDGTEKVKPDEEDTGAEGPMLKGAAGKVTAGVGRVAVAAGVRE